MKQTINCRGKLVDLSSPRVMGILNITPDSFYDGGKHVSEVDLLKKAEQHISEGADFLDIGAVSTRPNAKNIDTNEELKRLIPAIERVRREFDQQVISVDTYRSVVAEKAIEAGADIINDISGGQFDEAMIETVARLQVPYIIMHIQGVPASMQNNPSYTDVVNEVISFLMHRKTLAQKAGIHDVIIDPGFGFGKAVEHNYQLLQELDQFKVLQSPILVGFSRKSMINRVIKSNPENALNGTTVLNTIGLMKGAGILRVHDVREAMECIKIYQQLSNVVETT